MQAKSKVFLRIVSKQPNAGALMLSFFNFYLLKLEYDPFCLVKTTQKAVINH